MDGIHWEVLGIKVKGEIGETAALQGVERAASKYEEFIFCLGNKLSKVLLNIRSFN